MSNEPKTKKVWLLVEAEVDEAEGFTDEEYGKIAVGWLMTSMVLSADDCTRERGLVVHLKDGDVSFQKPRPIMGMYEIVEDGRGVYLLDGH
jgi:hypothetical protein